MPETSKYCGSIVSGVIDVSDEDQCRYWARRFVVTREVLLASVMRVGTAASEVEWELAERIHGDRHPECPAPFSVTGIGSLVSSGGVLLLQAAIA